MAMLRQKEGTTIADVMKVTGWQKHSVHGFLAGVVRKKLGLTRLGEIDGKRIYRIVDGKRIKAAQRTQAGGLMQADLDAVVEAELERLRSMPIAGASRALAREVQIRPAQRLRARSAAPEHRPEDSRDAYGGLDPATARLLDQLIAQHAKTPGKIVLPRRIKPGPSWSGHGMVPSHRVTVLQGGFAYDGKTYDSLSKIARLSPVRDGTARGSSACATGKE